MDFSLTQIANVGDYFEGWQAPLKYKEKRAKLQVCFFFLANLIGNVITSHRVRKS